MSAAVTGSGLTVEVAYARPREQVLLTLRLPVGATVRDAIERSGVRERFPEINLDVQKVGIFGRLSGLDEVLGDFDRVEIYRPLSADPKDLRRQRARLSRRGRPGPAGSPAR